jgi:hypothetical protein
LTNVEHHYEFTDERPEQPRREGGFDPPHLDLLPGAGRLRRPVRGLHPRPLDG